MQVFRGLTAALMSLAAAAACAVGTTDGSVAGAPPIAPDGGVAPVAADGGVAPGSDGGIPRANVDAETPAGDSGSPPPLDDAAPPPPHDSGVVAPPDAGGGSCTLPSVAQTGVAACDQCQQSSCCDLIAACLGNNPPCTAIYDCTQNCDNGTLPDGGKFDSTNATAVDQCWNVCEQGQVQASTFDNQDNCVSTSCKTPCGL